MSDPLLAYLAGFISGGVVAVLLAQAAWYDWQPRQQPEPEYEYDLAAMREVLDRGDWLRVRKTDGVMTIEDLPPLRTIEGEHDGDDS